MWALALLSGCAEPITNAVFYEDERFLAALPSRQDLAAPAALGEAPAGTSAVLASAGAAARELDALLAPLVAATEAVRAEAPDGRSGTSRTWEQTLVAATTDQGVETWVIDCMVLRPEDGGAITWEMARADRAGDEPIAWASGELAGDRGWISFPADDGDTLEVSWTPAAPGAPESREVEIEAIGPGGAPSGRAWTLTGADRIAWAGDFAVTADELVWPGQAVAAHEAAGGRATGHVLRGEETLRFDTCWDAAGDEVWRGGDEGILPIGAEAACPTAAVAD